MSPARAPTQTIWSGDERTQTNTNTKLNVNTDGNDCDTVSGEF